MLEPLSHRTSARLDLFVFSSEDKTWVGEQINAKKTNAKVFAKQHFLKERTLRGWVRCVQHNVVTQQNKGRPRALDAIAERDLVNETVDACAAYQTLTKHELSHIIVTKATATNVRRGLSSLQANVSISTVKSLSRRLHLRNVPRQRKTHARVLAEHDPRNAYSQALLLNAFQTEISPHLILNQDSTQYIVTMNNCGENVLTIVHDEGNTDPPTRENPTGSNMCFAIKSHVLVSAAGSVAPMVLMFAESSMSPQALIVRKVTAISHSASDATAAGYLVFMKTH